MNTSITRPIGHLLRTTVSSVRSTRSPIFTFYLDFDPFRSSLKSYIRLFQRWSARNSSFLHRFTENNSSFTSTPGGSWAALCRRNWLGVSAEQSSGSPETAVGRLLTMNSTSANSVLNSTSWSSHFQLHPLVLLRNRYQTLPYSGHMGGGRWLKYRLDTLLLQLSLDRFFIPIRNGLFNSLLAYKIVFYVRPNFLGRSSRIFELVMNHDEVIRLKWWRHFKVDSTSCKASEQTNPSFRCSAEPLRSSPVKVSGGWYASLSREIPYKLLHGLSIHSSALNAVPNSLLDRLLALIIRNTLFSSHSFCSLPPWGADIWRCRTINWLTWWCFGRIIGCFSFHERTTAFCTRPPNRTTSSYNTGLRLLSPAG